MYRSSLHLSNMVSTILTGYEKLQLAGGFEPITIMRTNWSYGIFWNI